MADVFVSYASVDREKARMLSTVLADRGLTVWWDRTIPPGRIFDEVIQEQLAGAKCVVVLWSDASVRSDWVKIEAREATSRRILVPALIEDVAPPIEFKHIQAAHLTAWDGATDDPELGRLLVAVDALVQRPATSPGVVARPARRDRRPWGVRVGALLALAAVLAGSSWLFRRPARPARDGAPAASAAPAATPAAGAAPKPAPDASPPSTPPAAGGINLLAQENGGQVLAASSASWAQLIDGKEDGYVWVDDGEGVFAFRDERPARFDTFAVLIPDSQEANLKTFELLAGNDSPTGSFTPIGTFETRNLRLFKSPYQEFRFPPVEARYLKVRSLGSHRAQKGGVLAYEFRLFGTLE